MELLRTREGGGWGFVDSFDESHWKLTEAITACNRAVLENESSKSGLWQKISLGTLR